MEITYQLEKNDYLQYNRLVINRVPALKRQAILRFLVVPVIISIESLLSHMPRLTLLIVIPCVTLAWAAYLLWAQRRGVVAQTLARSDSIGLHTLSLQPDGLREQTSVLETWVKWQNVAEVAENPRMIVLFLSPRWGFIIPKHAFPSPDQAQAFLEMARAYRKSAADGTTPMLPSVPNSWPPAPQRIL